MRQRVFSSSSCTPFEKCQTGLSRLVSLFTSLIHEKSRRSMHFLLLFFFSIYSFLFELHTRYNYPFKDSFESANLEKLELRFNIFTRELKEELKFEYRVEKVGSKNIASVQIESFDARHTFGGLNWLGRPLGGNYFNGMDGFSERVEPTRAPRTYR